MSEISNYLVKKSNKLISASYSLTVNEQRLLLACLSKVDSRKKLQETDLFVVSVEQMKELFYTQENEKNVYRDLKEAAEKLLERKVRIDEPNSITGYTIANFVQAAKFEPDLMQVSVRFTYDLSPYLSELTEKFTEYRLGHIAQLTSSYAIRIYELIVSWFGRNGKYTENKIEIRELRQILDISDKYAQFGQLKQYILDPAIRQINENSDFNVSVEFTKRGRAYHWITFRFEQKVDIQAAEQGKRTEREHRALQNEAAKQNRVIREQQQEHEQKLAEIQKQWETMPIGTKLRHIDGSTWVKEQGGFLYCREKNATTPPVHVPQFLANGEFTVLEKENPTFRQPEPETENKTTSSEQTHTNTATDKSLAEKLTEMWKAGLISQDEFLNLISKS